MFSSVRRMLARGTMSISPTANEPLLSKVWDETSTTTLPQPFGIAPHNARRGSDLAAQSPIQDFQAPA